ncbi:imm11 family protein [Archangium violaceum]|uniref:imm11 family protein n=1 Tax=Archangium violaceum TaxID=83451 RepID=UPI0036DCF17C
MHYLLKDDMRIAGRWHLRHPVDEHGGKINPWQFTKSQRLEPQGVIHFPVKPDGLALEFTQDAFVTPVVHGRVVQLFERLGIQEVQFIPIQVDGHAEPYFVLNTLRAIRCIDDARCEEVQYWKPEDGEPEKVGEYRLVAGLRIDPAMVEGAHIFRPWGWPLALIVSEDLKQALEVEHITGTRFVEV